MEKSRNFGGRAFTYIGAIKPERDLSCVVVREFPQGRYLNSKNLAMHRYGAGPFCRFQVATGWSQGGVYVLTREEEILYVGECQNLEERWGTRGYGRIHPRNCFQGGQQTNCRINNLICMESPTSPELALWFFQMNGDKQERVAAETGLIASTKPPWNR